MRSFVQIDDVEDLMAGALNMTELERDCFFAMEDDEWTVQELADTTGRSRSMVQRAVKKLHDKGVLVREGKTDKTVYYVYRRAEMEDVRSTVQVILDNWHDDMHELLS